MKGNFRKLNLLYFRLSKELTDGNVDHSVVFVDEESNDSILFSCAQPCLSYEETQLPNTAFTKFSLQQVIG